jgi:hypothetical protein
LKVPLVEQNLIEEYIIEGALSIFRWTLNRFSEIALLRKRLTAIFLFTFWFSSPRSFRIH